MWLFTKNSFISIVQHREQPDNLCVRARNRKHLARLFPAMTDSIQETPDADYRFRLVVSKTEMAQVISDYIIHDLQYDNFKAAQEKGESAWSGFLHDVWAAGLPLQE
ncbi:MAG: hypothetical protein FWH22_09760 [Fibromonadales bacterium]|nr:hypothetical protein [Fibromonadales bacterium]